MFTPSWPKCSSINIFQQLPPPHPPQALSPVLQPGEHFGTEGWCWGFGRVTNSHTPTLTCSFLGSGGSVLVTPMRCSIRWTRCSKLGVPSDGGFCKRTCQTEPRASWIEERLHASSHSPDSVTVQTQSQPRPNTLRALNAHIDLTAASDSPQLLKQTPRPGTTYCYTSIVALKPVGGV